MDTLANDCAEVVGAVPQNIVAVQLWRGRCNVPGGEWLLLREKATTSAHEESLEVDTTLCATYGVRTRNALGLWSCFAYTTLGIPPVGVDPVPAGAGNVLSESIFDVSGRRAAGRLPAGRYFILTKRAGNPYPSVRETLVIH